MIPRSIELLALDFAFLSFVPIGKVQDYLAQCGEILCCVAGASAAFVLPHDHIKHPMVGVFHTPMTSRRPCEQLDVQC